MCADAIIVALPLVAADAAADAAGRSPIRQTMVSRVDNRRELTTPSTAISSFRESDLQKCIG